MKIKFTDLLNNYQDNTIEFQCKDIVDSKKILKHTHITQKNHITMMSCITAYAVESETLEKFINNKN